MADSRLRLLERQWKETGSPKDEIALLRERVRLGELSQDRLQLAASLGDPVAQEACDDAAPPLPLTLGSGDWVRALATHGKPALVAATLGLAEALRGRWTSFTAATRVGDLIDAASRWLEDTESESARISASRAAKPLSRSGWADALKELRPGSSPLLWNENPRLKFPHDALCAEQLATRASEAAGATSPQRAQKAALEASAAFDEDTRVGMDLHYNTQPPVDFARVEGVLKKRILAWALDRPWSGPEPEETEPTPPHLRSFAEVVRDQAEQAAKKKAAKKKAAKKKAAKKKAAKKKAAKKKTSKKKAAKKKAAKKR